MRTDLEVQDDVADEIRWDPRLRMSEIGAVVREGVVTLLGRADGHAAREAAAEAALRVAGVRGVANDVRVDLRGEDLRSDALLARAALETLRWDVLTPDEDVTVTVDGGWITLEGDVAWDYQRNAAEGALRNLRGLSGLTNRIRVLKPAGARRERNAAG